MPAVDITPPLPICDAMPVPPIPVLPTGLTLAVPLPSAPPFSARLCCKILQLTPGVAFPPIGFALNSTAIAAINAKLREMTSYFRLIPVLCPRE